MKSDYLESPCYDERRLQIQPADRHIQNRTLTCISTALPPVARPVASELSGKLPCDILVVASVKMQYS